jgi:purine-binding chemotaxis protein CheW
MADQYVTLGIANEIFAAPVERVQEILEMRPVARLPHAPGYLLGMIDVRGQAIPVVDLRMKLGLPPAEDTYATRIVVLKVRGAEREVVLGLKADRVFEVTILDNGVLEPPPEIGVRWRSESIAGIGRRGGAFVTVLDLDHVCSASELPILAEDAAHAEAAA